MSLKGKNLVRDKESLENLWICKVFGKKKIVYLSRVIGKKFKEEIIDKGLIGLRRMEKGCEKYLKLRGEEVRVRNGDRDFKELELYLVGEVFEERFL